MARTEMLAAVFPKESGVPEEYRLPLADQREYLVRGELRVWSGPVQEIRSPIHVHKGGVEEQVILGSVPSLSPEAAMDALEAAVDAYDHGRGVWPTMSVGDRIRHVERFVEQMKACRDVVVNFLMWEIGKTLGDSQKEFDRTIEYIRDTIEALKELDRASSRFTIQQRIIGQIRRAPLGVVLCMGPFNYPLNETFTTLIPALIMGNTVVFKPPKLGVLLFRPLLDAFRKAFPPGVINTVYGSGQTVITPMMSSGKIDVLAFIGTSRVADTIRKTHPKPHRLRCVLGLDAKNPCIILPDADLDLAVKECLLGTLSFNGQRCTALKMLFVHSSVVQAFLDKFCHEVENLSAGLPWTKGVQITPLPEPGKAAWLQELIDDARQFGAKVVNPSGGSSHLSLFSPAVVYPVDKRMKLYAEEQFGPIIPIAPFDRIEDAIEYVTESNFGQQVSLFGSDPVQMAHLIDPLVNQVCRVNLNCQCQRGPDAFPFTGRKDSAEGTLSVSDALRVFSIRTLVAAKESDLNKNLITTIVKERQSSFLSTDFLF